MKKIMKKILVSCLTAVFIVSSFVLARYAYQMRQAADIYDEARAIAVQPVAERAEIPQPSEAQPDATTGQTTELPSVEKWPEEKSEGKEEPVAGDLLLEQLQSVNLPALRAVNPDVVGWIAIPGTKVEYPVMQGEDSAFYLNHTWKGAKSKAGSIFLEWSADAAFGDFNTIVYGHRMINNTMFGSLKYYHDSEYLKEHPYVYVANDSGVHRYEVFSAYEASVNGATYQVRFDDDAAKEEFLSSCMDWSVVETGVVPTIRDRILTLSTCTGKGYDTRWVVQARLAVADNVC